MAFKIKLKPSGAEFTSTDEVTILEAAIKSSIYLEHSCMDGSCGTCKAKVTKGVVKQTGVPDSLSDNEIEDGYILTCCSHAASDVELIANYYPELGSIKKTVHACKVESLTLPTSGDVAILKLRLPPAADFKYLAGQYLQLIIKGQRRSYSIANISETYSGIELHIRKVTNGLFSEYIFNELKADQLLRLEGPYGSFFVHNGHAPIIFLSGGTGFAPVKAMVEQLLKEKTLRDIYIYWGASTKDGFYIDIANDWQSLNKNIKFIPVLSGDNEWDGRSGLVHQAVLDDFNDLSAYEVYACGSPDMINTAQKYFILNNLNPDNFYSDAFLSSHSI